MKNTVGIRGPGEILRDIRDTSALISTEAMSTVRTEWLKEGIYMANAYEIIFS
jgi:hypothetical protein